MRKNSYKRKSNENINSDLDKIISYDNDKNSFKKLKKKIMHILIATFKKKNNLHEYYYLNCLRNKQSM